MTEEFSVGGRKVAVFMAGRQIKVRAQVGATRPDSEGVGFVGFELFGRGPEVRPRPQDRPTLGHSGHGRHPGRSLGNTLDVARIQPRRPLKTRITLPRVALLLLLGGLGDATASTTILKEQVRTEALPLLIATNHLGLGAESQAVVRWVLRNRGPLSLGSNGLHSEGAAPLSLSPLMARTLGRLNQWYGLTATEANPITHAQLESGALSAAAIERIRGIFERAIARGVRIGSTWVTPETGGEATIDRELHLIEVVDPRWSTVQDLVRVSRDPQAIAEFSQARAAEIAAVDTHGLLKVALARFRLGTKGSAEEVQRALLTVARNAAPTYSFGPEEQLALITGRDWQGRYVGAWHTHSPHDVGGAWGGGDVPSFEDMRNAVEFGQFLTLSFQPDGFDLYDAEPLGDAKRIDLKLLRVIRYRSPAWRAHFQKLHPATK